LREPVVEPGRCVSQDLERALARPADVISVNQDLLPRRIGEGGCEEHLPDAAQQADVGVVEACAPACHPERQRHGHTVLLIREAFVPGPVGDRSERHLDVLEIGLREGDPARCSRVLALEGKTGETEGGGIDPVVVREVLAEPPRIRIVVRDLLPFRP